MKKHKSKLIRYSVIILLISAIVFTGWRYLVNRGIYLDSHKAVPIDLIYDAAIPGMPDVRIVVNPVNFDFSDSISYRTKNDIRRAFNKNKTVVDLLVISGGGPDGAFGAGFLSGLSDSGQRPQYDIVTGVSTGALIAPAAFVGPSYDNVLKEIYTKVSDKDILGNNIQDLLLGKRPSLFNLNPLRRVLENSITQELVDAIADEYAKGRQLYVLTTNIDARRMVVWDMGAIASYRTKRSLELFRKVVMASSSIPAAFPPTKFKVIAGGKAYEELHVDGSIGTQMFGCLILVQQIKGTGSKGRVFIIRNGKMWSDPGTIKPMLSDIATVSLSMLLTNQGYTDLLRMYGLAKSSGVDFNCTFVPQDFNETSNGIFDPVYMTKLFKLGHDMAMAKEPWQKSPTYQKSE